jgi:hypothetical protein
MDSKENPALLLFNDCSAELEHQRSKLELDVECNPVRCFACYFEGVHSAG